LLSQKIIRTNETERKKAYMGVEAIWHELKFTIRRDEWNSSIIFKSWQPYTLVEFDIFQLHWLALATFERPIVKIQTEWTIVLSTYDQCSQRELYHSILIAVLAFQKDRLASWQLQQSHSWEHFRRH
jgi:hypothetical protein